MAIKYILAFLLPLLASCATLPQLYQSAEHIADDTAVKMQLSQEALQKGTNVDMNLKINNTNSP